MQRDSNGNRLGGVTGKGFLPGRSGNPGGRPKGTVKLSTCYERSLARPFPDDPEGRTYAQVIADKAVELAALSRESHATRETRKNSGPSAQLACRLWNWTVDERTAFKCPFAWEKSTWIEARSQDAPLHPRIRTSESQNRPA